LLHKKCSRFRDGFLRIPDDEHFSGRSLPNFNRLNLKEASQLVVVEWRIGDKRQRPKRLLAILEGIHESRSPAFKLTLTQRQASGWAWAGMPENLWFGTQRQLMQLDAGATLLRQTVACNTASARIQIQRSPGSYSLRTSHSLMSIPLTP
jgi:hypothetical protein